jgi:hypothetical protein
MTTQETAKRYGVPMPETCRDLRLGIMTAFYWVEIEKDVFVLKTKAIDGFDSFSHVQPMNEAVRTIYAPQMHEIAPFVPKNLVKGCYSLLCFDGGSIGNEDELCLMYGVMCINKDQIDEMFWLDERELPIVSVSLNHYAEAYAQLYLKLKGEKLI